MHMNLFIVSLRYSLNWCRNCNSLAFRINFAKIHIDSDVVISMTLLFSRMLSLMKIFH